MLAEVSQSDGQEVDSVLTTRRAFIGGVSSLVMVSGRVRAEAPTGHLRYGLSAFPPNLQPWVSTGSAAGTVKLLVYGRLLGYDKTGTLVGELAQSWSLEPDGTWVFKLRPNAVFHNGEKVTADDVKWTIEQIASEKSAAYMRTQFQNIAQIETPDPLTVRLTTKVPLAVVPNWFANYNVGIVWRGSPANAPVGAGSFVLTAQERGTSLELTAFDKYCRPDLPRLQSISMVAYPDENLRTSALRAGDIDLIEYVPWQSMSAIQADPNLRLQESNGAAFMDVIFNGSKPPFSDPRVRLAVAHAVKREDVVQGAFFGRGKGLEGVPIAEGSPYYDEVLAHGWKYDPAKSKALLAAAGFADGFNTTLLATAQYSMHKDTAEIVQQYLGAIGIRCELKLPDWSTRVSMGIKGQYDIAIHGLSADSNDPDGLTVVLNTALGPGQERSFGVSAPRVADAFNRGRAEFDQAKRVQIYKEMQQAALEEVPMASLVWRSQGYGMSSHVSGFTNLPGALSTASGAMLTETFLA